jgi:hypothetical protein
MDDVTLVGDISLRCKNQDKFRAPCRGPPETRRAWMSSPPPPRHNTVAIQPKTLVFGRCVRFLVETETLRV